jgi:hypothetical protein
MAAMNTKAANVRHSSCHSSSAAALASLGLKDLAFVAVTATALCTCQSIKLTKAMRSKWTTKH